jgi:murein L,D-transpeptidase YafK
MVRFTAFALMLVASEGAGRSRLEAVRAARTADVQRLLAAAGLSFPAQTVYLRAFKEERHVELWAGGASGPLSLVKVYTMCAASGTLGPKRREGDLQVPEGLYVISEFNPASQFHLSMKVSYPNTSDRLRGDAQRPGGLIYLHGHCASIGCIAIEDGPIEEVYLVAERATTHPLRIDVFPARLTPAWLRAHANSEHASLWKELMPAFERFESARRPLSFTIGADGSYIVSERP